MCEKQKPETKTEKKKEKIEQTNDQISEKSEHEELSYYYDDSCGYEIYIDEESNNSKDD